MLNIFKLGNDQRYQFIAECSTDETRFEKPIRKNKIHTFTDALKKQKMSVKGNVVKARMQRDLSGHLLRISLETDLDIEKVLSYPLTPVPMSMCHVDGSICETEKSALSKILGNQVESSAPTNVDVMIFDRGLLLHLMKDLPANFGNRSKKFLQMVL